MPRTEFRHAPIRARGGSRPAHVAGHIPSETAGFLRRAAESLRSSGDDERIETASTIITEANGNYLVVANSLVGSHAIELAIPYVPESLFEALCTSVSSNITSTMANKNGSHVVEATLARVFPSDRAPSSGSSSIVAAFKSITDRSWASLVHSPYASFVLRKVSSVPDLAAVVELPILNALRKWEGVGGVNGIQAASLDSAAAPLISNTKYMSGLLVPEIVSVIEFGFQRRSGEGGGYPIIVSPPCALCISGLLGELKSRGEEGKVEDVVKRKVLANQPLVHEMLEHPHSSILLAHFIRSMKAPNHFATVHKLNSMLPTTSSNTNHMLDILAALVTYYCDASGAKDKANKCKEAISLLVKLADTEHIPSPTDIPALHLLSAIANCVTDDCQAPALMLISSDIDNFLKLSNTGSGSELVISVLHSTTIPMDLRLALATKISENTHNLLSRHGSMVIINGILEMPLSVSVPGGENRSSSELLKLVCKVEEGAIKSLDTASYRSRQGNWFKDVADQLGLDSYKAGRKTWREMKRMKWRAKLK